MDKYIIKSRRTKDATGVMTRYSRDYLFPVMSEESAKSAMQDILNHPNCIDSHVPTYDVATIAVDMLSYRAYVQYRLFKLQ